MAISGHGPVVRIAPRPGEAPAIPADEAWRHRPPGSGIPQRGPAAPERFAVVAGVADGRRHRGGGAGFRQDPRAAKTMRD